MGEIMNIIDKISKTEEETKELAADLAKLLAPGDVITLAGDLGAGKTTFTKGIALGLGISDIITSPTFTIVKEYEGDLSLYHMDVYRLEYSEEDIGFSEYFNGDGISVVEWAQFIQEYLPEERLDIKIDYLENNQRKINFYPSGEYFEKVVDRLMMK